MANADLQTTSCSKERVDKAFFASPLDCQRTIAVNEPWATYGLEPEPSLLHAGRHYDELVMLPWSTPEAFQCRSHRTPGSERSQPARRKLFAVGKALAVEGMTSQLEANRYLT
jgi:hypothetical protein